MRRLHLDGNPTHPADPAALISGLRLGDRAPADRPYTVVNFVSSVDGRATVNGGSSGLSDAGDREIFHALRGCADAVLAGTGTLAAERYGALVRRPEVAAQRERLGLEPQPLAVTVTRTSALPDIPLLRDPGSRVLVYSTATDPELDSSAARADVRVIHRDRDALTMRALLADLRAAHGVRLLLCEGGPTVFGELVAEHVADELFLTVAPKLAGGEGLAVTRCLELPEPHALTLEWALEQDGSLYLRYALNPEPLKLRIS